MKRDSVADLVPEFATLLIMQELRRSRFGKCVCDIAASIGVDEPSIYDDLAFLLAYRWVEIEEVDKVPEFTKLLSQTKRATSNIAELLDNTKRWFAFFREVGLSEFVPVYVVRLTDQGQDELKRLRKRHFQSLHAPVAPENPTPELRIV